jgi:hypothetical protein
MTTGLILGGAAMAFAATTTVTVPATQPWTNTGVDVSGSVTLQASGTIDVGSPEGNLGPAGSKTGCVAGPASFSGQWVFDGPPCWSLIAKVGDNGQVFGVGNGGTFSVSTGPLYLGVDDEVAAFGDNSGSWTVQVSTGTPAPRPARPNGCSDTYSRDGFFNFTGPCNNHDTCYMDKGGPRAEAKSGMDRLSWVSSGLVRQR